MDEAKTKKPVTGTYRQIYIENKKMSKDQEQKLVVIVVAAVCLFYLILKSNRKRFLQAVIFCGTVV